MLYCLPRSICSWNFLIRDLPAGEASLEFDWLSEQGSISYAGKIYRIEKQGHFSGHWTVEREERIADAQKESVLTRTFLLNTDSGTYTLQAQSIFSTSFELLQSGQRVGTIARKHPFTRRSLIDCRPSVDEMTQLFAFWLVVIIWRRASDNS